MENIININLTEENEKECSNKYSTCIFHKLGCEFKGIKEELKDHCESNALFHHSLMIESMLEMSEKIHKLENNQKQLSQSLNSLMTQPFIELHEDINKNWGLLSKKSRRSNNIVDQHQITNHMSRKRGEKTQRESDGKGKFVPLNLDFENCCRGVNIYKNRAVNLSKAKNIHKFIFADLALNTLNNGLNKVEKIKWRIIIHNRSSWLGLGCCNKEQVIKNNYKFGLETKDHGCFLISTNGYLWNTTNEQENGMEFEIGNKSFPLIKENDTILFNYSSHPVNQLKISIIQNEEEFSLVLNDILCPPGNTLVPCAVFVHEGKDDISFEVFKQH